MILRLPEILLRRYSVDLHDYVIIYKYHYMKVLLKIIELSANDFLQLVLCVLSAQLKPCP